MTEPDYFHVNRKLLRSAHWLDGSPFDRRAAWIDLIGLARWQDGCATVRGVQITLERGHLCWSMVGLSKRWRWSEWKVKRYLKWLEDHGQICMKNTHVTTVIAITNYDRYQAADENTTSWPRTGHGLAAGLKVP